MKIEIKHQAKVLNFALLQLRDSVRELAELVRNNVNGGARIAERIDKQLEALDYATAAISVLQGNAVLPGAGGTADPDVVFACEQWQRRGKRPEDLAA